MSKKFLFVLLCVGLAATSGCEEQEALNPRRAAQPGAETQSTFRGSYSLNNSESLDPCPNGPGSVVTIDLTKATMSVQIPVQDKNLAPSDSLQAANAALQSDGSPTLNSQTGTFSASYIIDDPDEDFDANGCSDAVDTYAQQIRLTVTGTASNSSIQGTTFEISNVCTNNSVTPSICSGSVSGSINSN